MSLERTNSLRSSQMAYSQSGAYTARSFNDVEKMLYMRRPTSLDAMSDTSSQQERKFANLLGGDEPLVEDDEPIGTSNVGHRLYRTGTETKKLRQDRLRDEREKILMKEMTQMTQRPAITGRAREKPAKGHLFSEHASEWKKKRDNKVDSMARESRERAEADVTGEPLLNTKSRMLLDDSGTYQDPINGWEQHYAKYCAKHSTPVNKSMFNPNINANAVRADADQAIHDRLFNDSTQRREKLRDAAVARQQKELEDPATGRPYFTPQRLAAPSKVGVESPPRDQSVFEQLHSSARKREASAEADPEATFTPKINPASEKLAEKVRKPLYTPTPTKEQKAAEQEQEQVSDRSPNKVNLNEFFRRTTRCDHVRQSRMEQLRKEREEREGSHCSFQPRINKHSVELFEAAHVYGKPMTTPTASVSVHQPANKSLSFDQTTGSAGSPVGTPHTTRLQGGSPVAGSTPRSATKRGPSMNSANASAIKRVAPEPSQPNIAAGAPAQAAGGDGGDDYINAFEQQMYAVLDEWRRLEEV